VWRIYLQHVSPWSPSQRRRHAHHRRAQQPSAPCGPTGRYKGRKKRGGEGVAVQRSR
jgi:hypothetical protein